MKALNKNADWRVARFEPDIVFVMLSAEEFSQASNDSFINALENFVTRLRDDNCELVICTPAVVDKNNSQPAGFDSVEFPDAESQQADRLRQIIDEHKVVLIENIDELQTATTSAAIDESLSSAGHKELAQRLLIKLGLTEPFDQEA
jgi:hypothetical protein